MQSSQHWVFEKMLLNEQRTNTFKLKMNVLHLTLVHISDQTHATCIYFLQDWLFLTKYFLSLSTQIMTTRKHSECCRTTHVVPEYCNLRDHHIQGLWRGHSFPSEAWDLDCHSPLASLLASEQEPTWGEQFLSVFPSSWLTLFSSSSSCMMDLFYWCYDHE